MVIPSIYHFSIAPFHLLCSEYLDKNVAPERNETKYRQKPHHNFAASLFQIF